MPPDKGKTAMENCLAKSKDINLVYSINEPSGGGAAEALEAAGIKDAIIVSVDGGCNPGLEAGRRAAPSGPPRSSTR